MSISDQTNEVKFTGLRAYIWPVTRKEAKKVLPLALMMFFVLFNYTILRDIKDVLVLTAHGCGSESFSFLKAWGTLPCVIILMACYGKLSTTLSKPVLFRSTVLFFFGVFATLGYVVFPNADLLYASPEWIDKMAIAYPRARHIVALIGNWGLSLFYIFSELWGSVGISVIFWQLANEITRVREAKRMYPLFGLVGNFGLMISGPLLIILTRMHSHISVEEGKWPKILNWVFLSLSIAFCVILYLHNWIQKNVLTDKELYNPEEIGAKKKKKVKLGFIEGLRIILTSKYLGFIALLIFGYNMTISFVDATFKNQLKLLFMGNQAGMTEFYGAYSLATGVFAAFLMIAGANLTRRLSWKTCALITPLVVLVAGSSFFLLAIFKEQASVLLSAFGLSPVALAVFIGAGLIIIVRSAKYSLFDPTKEMAYIPLDDSIKTQGKAAVDGVGGRLAKSSSGVIQQILFVLIPTATQMSIAPLLGILSIIITLLWLYSVLGLSRLFEQKMQEERSDN